MDLLVCHEASVRPWHHCAQYSAIRAYTITKCFSEIGLGPFPDSRWSKIRAQQIFSDWNSTGEVLQMTTLTCTSRGEIVAILARRSTRTVEWSSSPLIDLLRRHQGKIRRDVESPR